MEAHFDEMLKFLEGLFTKQSEINAADLGRLHESLHQLSNRVGCTLSLRDLKYYIVKGKMLGLPNKLHQLKTACSMSPSWVWRTRCGMQVCSTRVTAKVCSEVDARSEVSLEACKLCMPDCLLV